MRQQDRYDSLYQYYAEKFGLPWIELKAQMLAESAGNPDAASPVGAIGLAQFMHATWLEWWDGTPGIQGHPKWDRNNPEACIRAQCAYMRWLMTRVKGNWDAAWAAYNWGIGRVQKILRVYGPTHILQFAPVETVRYIARIRLIKGKEYARLS